MTRNSYSRGCAAGATLTATRGEPRSRRFDDGQLVSNEIISHFIDQQFLDPEDDRVLDELLARPVAGGLTLGDLVSRVDLRERLRERRDAAPAEAPAPIPVSPQHRREITWSRLAQRANSVVMRILTDLSLSRQGREVARTALRTGSGPNVQAVAQLLDMEIRAFTGKARAALTADETEAAFRELNNLGDALRDRIREALGRRSRSERNAGIRRRRRSADHGRT